MWLAMLGSQEPNDIVGHLMRIHQPRGLMQVASLSLMLLGLGGPPEEGGPSSDCGEGLAAAGIQARAAISLVPNAG